MNEVFKEAQKKGGIFDESQDEDEEEEDQDKKEGEDTTNKEDSLDDKIEEASSTQEKGTSESDKDDKEGEAPDDSSDKSSKVNSETTLQNKPSEEFWNYNKRIEEQLKIIEQGEAMNNLFEDKDQSRTALFLKQEEEKKKLEETILDSWPSFPPVVKSQSTVPATPPLETTQTAPLQADKVSQLNDTVISPSPAPVVVKPWLRR